MTTATASDKDQQLGLLFQYTVEAYKQFEKLAEDLPNPMSARMFSGFARDERQNRDVIDIKYLASATAHIPLTLGNDLRFQDILKGELSHRESIEMLISREQSMERKLKEFAEEGAEEDRNLFEYVAASKRAHLALLERELGLAKTYKTWLTREDAEDLVVNGDSDQ